MRYEQWSIHFAVIMLLTGYFYLTYIPSAFAYDQTGIEEPQAAIARDDAKTAFALAKPLAEKGDAQAQHLLGALYLHGWGVDKNIAQALKWFKASADQGDAAGESSLGYMYDHGKGVDRNPVEAARLYGLSAIQGWARGQFNLGMCYLRGDGIDRDEEKGIQLITLAANQGLKIAQARLGYLYEQAFNHSGDNQVTIWFNKGKDPRWLEEALKWYKLAAASDHPQQFYALGTDKGSSFAQEKLGYIYLMSKDIPHDYNQSLNWYKMSAAQGNSESKKTIGLMFEQGQGVEKNPKEAESWFKQAADQHYNSAYYALGYFYGNHDNMPIDYPEAKKWDRMAAKKNLSARYALGCLYADIDKDYVTAYAWVTLAGNDADARQFAPKLAGTFNQQQRDQADVLIKSLLSSGLDYDKD